MDFGHATLGARARHVRVPIVAEDMDGLARRQMGDDDSSRAVMQGTGVDPVDPATAMTLLDAAGLLGPATDRTTGMLNRLSGRADERWCLARSVQSE